MDCLEDRKSGLVTQAIEAAAATVLESCEESSASYYSVGIDHRASGYHSESSGSEQCDIESLCKDCGGADGEDGGGEREA